MGGCLQNKFCDKIRKLMFRSDDDEHPDWLFAHKFSVSQFDMQEKRSRKIDSKENSNFTRHETLLFSGTFLVVGQKRKH